MAERFRDVSRECPMAGCGASPGEPCLNIATGKPMYDETGPVVHPARSERFWRQPGGPLDPAAVMMLPPDPQARPPTARTAPAAHERRPPQPSSWSQCKASTGIHQGGAR
jgi:hypothetical protein